MHDGTQHPNYTRSVMMLPLEVFIGERIDPRDLLAVGLTKNQIEEWFNEEGDTPYVCLSSVVRSEPMRFASFLDAMTRIRNERLRSIIG